MRPCSISNGCSIHANQTRLSISSLHAQAKHVANLLGQISQRLK